MSRLLSFAFCLASCGGAGLSQGAQSIIVRECSLRMVVTHELFGPASVMASVFDSAGQHISSRRSVLGVVDFCELGYGPYRVELGDRECETVILKGIELSGERTRVLQVTLPRCRPELFMPSQCYVSVIVSCPRCKTPPRLGLDGKPISLDGTSRAFFRVAERKGSPYKLSLTYAETVISNKTLDCSNRGKFIDVVFVPTL